MDGTSLWDEAVSLSPLPHDTERDEADAANPEPHEKPAFYASNLNLHQYMREVNAIPLLSHEETMELFRLLEEKRRAIQALEERCVQAPQHEPLLWEAKKEAAKIKETIATANLRLVVYLANRYQGRGLSIQDLVQEGNIGIMRAIEKFDYRLGYRFSTYATWWIRQGILRSIHQQGRLIRIPTHMLEKFQNHLKDHHKAGGQPTSETDDDILGCDEMEDEVQEMVRLMEVMRDPLSLDAPVTDEGLDLQEVMRDENERIPEERIIEQDLRDKLRSAMRHLTLREEIILRLRYGIDLPGTHTLEEVGRLFGLTKERIRQIECRAVQRLQQAHAA